MCANKTEMDEKYMPCNFKAKLVFAFKCQQSLETLKPRILKVDDDKLKIIELKRYVIYLLAEVQ